MAVSTPPRLRRRPPLDVLPRLRRARDHMDMHYASRVELDRLAGLAAMSRFHFVRSFEAAYAETPMRYLTRRRIERAQDLLRLANLTVTEVCMAVGFSSLGSFSLRFTQLVGERAPPATGRGGWRGADPTCPAATSSCAASSIPGGRPATEARSRAICEKRGARAPPTVGPMITNVSLTTIFCLDQQETLDFYVDVLGFEVHTDITVGEGYRWVTVSLPGHPELEVVLNKVGPPLDAEAAAFIERQLGKGQLGGVGLRVDDCLKTAEQLKARGVSFVQEPSERPYGTEAVIRDNSGNWLVLVEPKPFTASDFVEDQGGGA